MNFGLGSYLTASVQTSIYNFTDYRSYLRAAIEEKVRKNPAFSLRAFARDAGLSPSHISRALSGQKRLSASAAHLISQSLVLNAREVAYFQTLIELEKSKDSVKGQGFQNEKRLLKSLAQQQRGRVKILSLEVFQAISNWYHFAIVALAGTKNFQSNSNWVAQRLGIKALDARFAVDRLIQLGLLEEKNGVWTVVDNGAISTTDDFKSAAIQENHRQHLGLAEKALDSVPVELREFNNLSLVMNHGDIPKAKKKIRAFVEEFNSEMDRARGGRSFSTEYSILSSFAKREGTVIMSIFRLRTSGLFILSVLSLSFARAEGIRVGNGGGAWVCQETGGSFRWVSLVDLFEAEKEFGLKRAPEKTLLMATDPWAIFHDRYEFILENVPQLAHLLVLSESQLRAVMRMVPESTELTRINDDQIRLRPSPGSCDKGILYYGQIADYTFDGRLLIAGDLWSTPSFSNQDRAALLLHEVVYKSLRDRFGDMNSSRARAIVGLIFSDLSAEQIASEIGNILARGNSTPQESSWLNGPFHLVCFAHIESETSATVPGKMVYLKTGEVSGLWSTKLLNFLLSVRTIGAKPSFPIQLAITDTKTGVRTTSDEQSTGTSFKREGRVALSLELTNTKAGKIVILECRAAAIKE